MESMSLGEEKSPEQLDNQEKILQEAFLEESESGEHFDKSESEKKEKFLHPQYEIFLSEFQALTDPESKLNKAIEFMEISLAQSGTPHFKSFWDARHLCLQLFKENISPNLRSQLWIKYSELSKEARRLKEILDEQSTFAAEQIEIAIKALETELEGSQEKIEKVSSLDFMALAQSLKDKNLYQALQAQLNLFNVQASRINALRKELIKTEMRIRFKNKFFQRLSEVGDKVFPRRKELIKEISNHFIQDIESFISKNFPLSENIDSLFALREEIKFLQSLAKHLTLNTHAFTQTRMRLSECWDKIKQQEKERKKVRAQQRASFKQNAEGVLEKIRAFSQAFTKGELSTTEANEQIDQVVQFMREVELGREELKFLREELASARKPLIEKIQAAEEERQQQNREREQLKKQKIQELKEGIEFLLNHLKIYDAEKIVSERDQLFDKIQNAGLNKAEKQEFERLLKPLRNAISDAISEKKEKALMTLSDDDRQAIQQLKEVLQQRKERRQEIRQQLELLRKSKGGSGFDIKQAMSFNSQINEEKERLEKINQGIKEIEQKIAELEVKI